MVPDGCGHDDVGGAADAQMLCFVSLFDIGGYREACLPELGRHWQIDRAEAVATRQGGAARGSVS